MNKAHIPIVLWCIGVGCISTILVLMESPIAAGFVAIGGFLVLFD